MRQSRNSPAQGFSLLEIALALALAAIITTSVGAFFLVENRVWVTIGQRQDSMEKLMEIYFLMYRRLGETKADTLITSTVNKIISGGDTIFEFVPAQKSIEWNGSTVIEDVLVTFTYSDPGGWVNNAAGWADNFASGVIRIQVQTLGESEEKLNFMVRPRKRN